MSVSESKPDACPRCGTPLGSEELCPTCGWKIGEETRAVESQRETKHGQDPQAETNPEGEGKAG